MSSSSSKKQLQLSDEELVNAAKEALMELDPGRKVPLKDLFTRVQTRLAPKANQLRLKVFKEVLRCYYDEINISYVKLDPNSEAETQMASLVEY
jgi:hypothetical protein